MPRIPFPLLDVLIQVEMGKNISGVGMDPNIIGRFSSGLTSRDIEVVRMVVLRLTPESGSNAMGVGLADVVPDTLAGQIDWQATYMNAYTSGAHRAVKLPMVAATEEKAILTALSMPAPRRGQDALVALIQNTLRLSDLWLSEALWADAHRRGLRSVGSPAPLIFEADGRLAWASMASAAAGDALSQ